MTVRNRELSQFGSFIYIDNNTKDIGITTEATPYVGIGTTNAQEKLHVVGQSRIDGSLNVSGIITAALFDGQLDGNAATATTATSLETARNFSITGDFVTASSVSFDGTSNVALGATITLDSIILGTYTSGDYVESISGTSNEIVVTGGSGEGSTPSIGLSSNLELPGDLYVTGVSTFTGIATFTNDVYTQDLFSTSINASSFYLNGSPLVEATAQIWQQATGSDIYRALGNVGIGTSTNLYKLSVNGQIESQASQGTAPFVVRSTTNVPNLNASLLSGKSAPTGDIVGTTATQTLTSKTINLTNNTLSGTLSQFNTALSDADFVSTTGTETLTNKTLTAPVISSISNGGIQTIPTGTGTLVSTSSVGIVTSGMIADLNIINDDVADNANISFSKISTVGIGNSIENDDIANSTIQNTKLVNSTISGVSLGSNLNSLIAGTFLSGDPYNGSVARTWNISATSSNTPDTLVSRDSNGDFSVGTINVENFNSTGNGIIDGNLGIGTTLARHTLDVIGGFSFSGEAIESVKITAGTLLANQNINLTDGMVHYFTSNEVGVSTANVRIDASTSLDSKMNVGTTVAVTVIITPNTVGYSTCINIDGSYNDVKWLGGTDPTTGSSSGVDIYTYQIIKTASSTFTVLGSVNNFA